MVSAQRVAETAGMVGYRRNRVVGATYFFTVTLRDRRSDLLVQHIDLLRESWSAAGKRVTHEVVAAVVLPDHLHAVIRMHDAECDYPRLWQEIKKGFTRRVRERCGTRISPWQSRYWEHTIRDEADLQAHVDYVHINPVKHGYARRVAAWPHSSFHRYVQRGWLPVDWSSERGQRASPRDQLLQLQIKSFGLTARGKGVRD